MGLAYVQFYKNKYSYPKYTNTLTPYGPEIESTPVGVNLKSGSLRLKGTMTDFMSCNYMRITRDDKIIFGWIDEVNFHTDNSFIVNYSVDPFRTYKNKIDIGTQFVKRRSQVTNKKDLLLGGLSEEFEIETSQKIWGNYNTRTLVIQVIPEPAYIINNTPVQPTPYHFYFASYNPDNWQSSDVLVEFYTKLRASSAISNIITTYSLPYMNTVPLPDVILPLFEGEELIDSIEGFKMLSGTLDVKNLLTRSRLIEPPMDYNELSKIQYTTQIMVPDSGIINIPNEIWAKGNVKLRQDIDLFSGASNYMITYGSNDNLSALSIRGSSTSSIPIISNPYDTYLSQNQNALTTSLMGDVASLAVGAGTFAMAPNIISGGAVLKGASGLVSGYSSMEDKKNMSSSNPPSFLGTAMANHYSNMFFLITKYAKITNKTIVNERYGYPVETIQNVSMPTSGYTELQNCSVDSTDGTVPKWAITEINSLFNDGLLIM